MDSIALTALLFFVYIPAFVFLCVVIVERISKKKKNHDIPEEIAKAMADRIMQDSRKHRLIDHDND